MKIYFLLILLLTAKGFAQAGSFDATFDEDGRNRNCYSPSDAYNSFNAGIQSTGKILSYEINYAIGPSLTRWNINGSLDNNFGVNGILGFPATPPFTSNQSSYYPSQMVIQPDDKIIIMGLQQNNTYPNAYWVARLLPDGAFDPSFSNDGYRDLSFGSEQDRGTCVALQTDGKILVGGTSGSTAQYFTVARLLSDGSFDTDFGVNGVVQTPFSGTESFANCIAVQDDGKIILGGYTVNAPYAKDFAMIRYETDGSIDNSFGVNGKVITTLNTSFSDYINKIVLDSQGKIIASGCSSFEVNYKLAMARYNSAGALDTSFGNNGIVITNTSSRNSDVVVQIDDKIIVVGGFEGGVFAVWRYLENGQVDADFGNSGFVAGFEEGYASCVLIQADNKIVVTGNTPSPSVNGAVCSAIIRLDPGVLSNEEFSNHVIKLYPNPVVESIYASIKEPMKYVIYSVLGMKLEEGKIENDLQGIEVMSLAIGQYILQLTNGEGMKQVLRFVKE